MGSEQPETLYVSILFSRNLRTTTKSLVLKEVHKRIISHRYIYFICCKEKGNWYHTSIYECIWCLIKIPISNYLNSFILPWKYFLFVILKSCAVFGILCITNWQKKLYNKVIFHRWNYTIENNEQNFCWDFYSNRNFSNFVETFFHKTYDSIWPSKFISRVKD